MPASTDSATGHPVYTVSALNRAARGLLENGLPRIWVEGEISNLAQPASGHVYFSLKDATAQVRCALFRARANLLGFKPANGMQVLARARVSLYEPRGDYQLQIEQLEEAGHGALQRAFEALKTKLAREGLFDAARKKPLPVAPRVIGVITSPTGAAIHDILNTLRRRCPLLRVILYPVPVQGAGAAEKIAAMLHTASARAECDVLILARGGGSLEDLWAFNEEIVARAIEACRIPVVSGIGHEVDFTIADFVADARAETPTGAAERVAPDAAVWLRALQDFNLRLAQTGQRQLDARRERLDWLQGRLDQLHPARLLRDRMQRLDELELRLGGSIQQRLQLENRRCNELTTGLRANSPLQRLQLTHTALRNLTPRLVLGLRHQFNAVANRLGIATTGLQAVSPLATLARGYAIVTGGSGIITSARQLKPRQELAIRLHRGGFHAQVTTLDPDQEKS